MFIPLPDDLEAQLDELGECGPYVDDNQYNDIERERLKKLRELGLVCFGWMVSAAGRARINAKEENQHGTVEVGG